MPHYKQRHKVAVQRRFTSYSIHSLFPCPLSCETVRSPPYRHDACSAKRFHARHFSMHSRTPRTALPSRISQLPRSSHLPYANLRPPKHSLSFTSNRLPRSHRHAALSNYSHARPVRPCALLTHTRPPSLSLQRPARPGHVPPPVPFRATAPEPHSRNFSCLSPAPSI